MRAHQECGDVTLRPDQNNNLHSFRCRLKKLHGGEYHQDTERGVQWKIKK